MLKIWEKLQFLEKKVFNNQIYKTQGYNSQRWMQALKKNLHEYKNSIKKDCISASPYRESILPVICALALEDKNLSKKKLKIADLGGGSGWTYLYLLNSGLKNKINHYQIIETQYVKNKMNNVFLGKNISYTNSFNKVDIFYTNSTLSYLSKSDLLRDFFERIQKSKPSYVCIDDFYGNLFVNNDYYALQNYYGGKIPTRFFSFKNFCRKINNLNYRLILSQPYISKILGVWTKSLPMRNFPKKYHIKPLTLIFKIKK